MLDQMREEEKKGMRVQGDCVEIRQRWDRHGEHTGLDQRTRDSLSGN